MTTDTLPCQGCGILAGRGHLEPPLGKPQEVVVRYQAFGRVRTQVASLRICKTCQQELAKKGHLVLSG